MLKHIPTGQPSSAGSRNHHHNDFNNETISGRLHNGNKTGNKHCNESSIYDSLMNHKTINNHHQTPSVHRHPLNQSQLSVNNLSPRLNHLGLNLSTSKHSINSSSPVVGNDYNHNVSQSLHHHLFHHHHHHHHPGQNGNSLHLASERMQNGGLDISRLSRLQNHHTTPSPAPVPTPAIHQSNQLAVVTTNPVNSSGTNVQDTQPTSWSSFCLKPNNNVKSNNQDGVKEMLTFLGLLCLVSLLLAMLSHIFLLKISPTSVTPSSIISPEEYTIVYEVTLALCALALSLNLCCLLVCAIQFLFAIKLVKSSYNQTRTNMYLEKSSVSRMCAVGGFFVSIPVFLTGMILYTFIQFHSTSAIIMSILIGTGILFCGCAMVHNVFVWQREKTNAVKELARAQCEAALQLQRQQQQQSQHQHHNQQPTSHQLQQLSPSQLQNQSFGLNRSTLSRNNCSPLKLINSSVINSNQRYHKSSDRHLQMSPGLSASPPIQNDINRITTSPPATPADDHPVNKSLNRSHHIQRETSGSISPGLPAATLDLSSAATTNSPHELSTLV